MMKEHNKVYYRRFDAFEVWMHVTVIISFLMLALTGLIIKFSAAGWAKVLAGLLGGYEAAGALHRFFALVTFGYFFTHLFKLLRKYRQRRREGKKILKMGVIFSANSMIPRLQDFKDFGRQFAWFMGLSEKPKWDRWAYFEKFDYWAVFWGVTVIGLSGLMLWFKTFFALFLPGWLLNVAYVVHSDEALLAVGFIFGIHFFNTHLRRESFPLDKTIFTGRMTEEEFKEKHPTQYERLASEGRLEELRAEPPPEWLERLATVFGFTTLSIGIVVLILIITAALG